MKKFKLLPSLIVFITLLFLTPLVLIAAEGVWEWQYPLPVKGIWASPDSDVYTVGPNGTIMRLNGTEWESMKSGTTEDLYGIWGSAADNIFAVGAGGTVLKYDNDNENEELDWISVDNISVTTTLRAIWGVDGSIFVVGNSRTVFRYDGSTWVQMKDEMKDVPKTNLSAVWGASATDVFAVGLDGKILHFNGTVWSVMDDKDYPLTGIWGSSGENVFAVGYLGTIYHYSRESLDQDPVWTTMTSNTIKPLFAIMGRNENDIYAAGLDGTIIHYGGTDWDIESIDEYPTLYSIQYVSAIICHFAGMGGTIVQKNDTDWSQESIMPNNLNDIWGNSETEIFAAGDSGTIMRNDGANWTQMSGESLISTDVHLNSIWGSSESSVFTVGENGFIYQYDGQKWNVNEDTYTIPLNTIWCNTGSDVFFAMGDSANILKYNNSEWLPINTATTSGLNAIWGISDTDIFAVGQQGEIIEYSGTVWGGNIDAPTNEDLNGVWVYSETGYPKVFAVGNNGTILSYYENSDPKWTIVNTNTGTDDYQFNDIWGSSSSNVFIVGERGTILNKTGNDWTTMSTGLNHDLKAIWGSSDDDVYAVGEKSSILHYPSSLFLTVQEIATEGDGVLEKQGMVSVLFVPDDNIRINLSATVVSGGGSSKVKIQPSEIKIFADQTHSSFNLKVSDDHIVNSDNPIQIVKITASATNLGSASATITITDNDPDLTLNLFPDTATEGDGDLIEQGEVNINFNTEEDLVVSLSSDLTSRLKVEETVTIPAGGNFVKFDLKIQDDEMYKTQTKAKVTASIEGWTDAEDTIEIADNDILAEIESPSSDVTVNEGESINFTGSVKGATAPLSLSWDFNGAAENSSLEEPGSVLLNTPGVFTVNFSATDKEGRTDSDSVTVTVNESGILTDEIESGCFINSVKGNGVFHHLPMVFFLFSVLVSMSLYCVIQRKISTILTLIIILLVPGQSAFALEKNTIGVKFGQSSPSDDAFKEQYDDPKPLAIYYDRFFSPSVSVDIEAGLANVEGEISALDNDENKIETDLELIQISSTVKWNKELLPFIHFYIGAGLDYWLYKETYDDASIDKKNEDGVSGYHGKTGLRMYTKDKSFKGFGVIIETVYSSIDRFGQNDTNLGGWTFSLGGIYSF